MLSSYDAAACVHGKEHPGRSPLEIPSRSEHSKALNRAVAFEVDALRYAFSRRSEENELSASTVVTGRVAMILRRR